MSTGDRDEWKLAETRGTKNVENTTSKSTYYSKAKESQSAEDAGRSYPARKSNGDLKMERFNANTAKSFLGKNVNIHLKDGSVIVNVLLTQVQRDELGKGNSIQCVSQRNKLKIPLKSIAWAESLNPCFMSSPNEN